MKPKRTKSIWGMVLGAALMVFSPFIGLSGTILGMNKSFHALGQSSVCSPDELASGIGTALQSTVAGFFCAACGLLILIVSVICFFMSGRSNAEQVALPPAP